MIDLSENKNKNKQKTKTKQRKDKNIIYPTKTKNKTKQNNKKQLLFLISSQNMQIDIEPKPSFASNKPGLSSFIRVSLQKSDQYQAHKLMRGCQPLFRPFQPLFLTCVKGCLYLFPDKKSNGYDIWILMAECEKTKTNYKADKCVIFPDVQSTPD